MTKAELARLLRGGDNKIVAHAAEQYASVLDRLNPANWNFNSEADALMGLLRAISSFSNRRGE